MQQPVLDSKKSIPCCIFGAFGETLSAGDDAIISDVGSILVVMNGDAILSGGSLLVVCDDDVVFRDNDTNGRRSEA